MKSNPIFKSFIGLIFVFGIESITWAQSSLEFTPLAPSQNEEAEPTASPEPDCHWPFEHLDIAQAQQLIWFKNKTRPGEGITIAHIDTGIIPFSQLAHDRTGQSGLVMPRDDRGRIVGLNFVEPHEAPLDNNPAAVNFGHGTETASILVGHFSTSKNSRHQFQGIVPWARLIPIKVTDSVVMMGRVPTGGTADIRNLAAGISKAVELNASVLNVSLGGIFDHNGLVSNAIASALERGAIVVAAAGQTLPINFLPLPANLLGVVSVTASNSNSEPWSDAFSHRMISWAAPGVTVCHLGVRRIADSSAPSDRAVPLARVQLKTRAGEIREFEGIIKRSSGTSYSTAFTTGAAALWLQYHGHGMLKALYGPKNISRLFIALSQRSAMETPPHWDTQRHGSGIINIGKLLAAALPCNDRDSQELCAVKLEEFLKSPSR